MHIIYLKYAKKNTQTTTPTSNLVFDVQIFKILLLGFEEVPSFKLAYIMSQ